MSKAVIKEQGKLCNDFLKGEETIKQLEALYSACNDDKNRWQHAAEALQREIAGVEQAKSENRLIELDYGFKPRVRNWNTLPGGNIYKNIISPRDEVYSGWVKTFVDFQENFARISEEQPEAETDPFWNNLWFPPLDAVCLYGLIAKVNPKLYIEVGSGNSTKFVRRAIKDHGLRTKIISIDPFPRAIIDDLCDEVIREGLEHVDVRRFQELGPDDVMFVDNSHRSFQNSDVTVFFTEVLPLLRSGVYWGIHDIFLPNDYPESWLGRFYNEQYILMAYLLGGAAGDQIEIPVAYLEGKRELLSLLTNQLQTPPWGGVPLVGGAFWMRKA